MKRLPLTVCLSLSVLVSAPPSRADPGEVITVAGTAIGEDSSVTPSPYMWARASCAAEERHGYAVTKRVRGDPDPIDLEQKDRFPIEFTFKFNTEKCIGNLIRVIVVGFPDKEAAERSATSIDYGKLAETGTSKVIDGRTVVTVRPWPAKGWRAGRGEGRSPKSDLVPAPDVGTGMESGHSQDAAQ